MCSRYCYHHWRVLCYIVIVVVTTTAEVLVILLYLLLPPQESSLLYCYSCCCYIGRGYLFYTCIQMYVIISSKGEVILIGIHVSASTVAIFVYFSVYRL